MCACPKCTAWWISAEWTHAANYHSEEEIELYQHPGSTPTPWWGDIWSETHMLNRWLCKALGSEYSWGRGEQWEARKNLECLRDRKKASLYQFVDVAQQYLGYVFVIWLSAWDWKGSNTLIINAIQAPSLSKLGSSDPKVAWSRES